MGEVLAASATAAMEARRAAAAFLISHNLNNGSKKLWKQQGAWFRKVYYSRVFDDYFTFNDVEVQVQLQQRSFSIQQNID